MAPPSQKPSYDRQRRLQIYRRLKQKTRERALDKLQKQMIKKLERENRELERRVRTICQEILEVETMVRMRTEKRNEKKEEGNKSDDSSDHVVPSQESSE